MTTTVGRANHGWAVGSTGRVRIIGKVGLSACTRNGSETRFARLLHSYQRPSTPLSRATELSHASR